LIPRFGIVGAAISTGSTMALGGLVGFLEIYFLYGMHPFSNDTVKFLVVGLFTGLVFYLLKSWISPNNIFMLIIMIGFLAVFYGLGVVLTRSLDDLDRDILGRIIGRFNPRTK
jgi:O-antigen/teichoic acid export membrane protein